MQPQQTSEFANAALAYLPQVQMKSRCDALELSLQEIKTLRHWRKIKLTIKCKAYAADHRAAGERGLLSEARVILVGNLCEHGVATSVPIEVEGDEDGNGAVVY